MDFDGKNKNGFTNWNYGEKKMQNFRSMTAIFAPGIILCFLFSLNVIKLNEVRRLPAVVGQAKALNLVEDESKTWYSQVKKGIEITVAKR